MFPVAELVFVNIVNQNIDQELLILELITE